MISQSPSPTFKPWWRNVWLSRFTVAPIGAFLLLLALACGASDNAFDAATPEASTGCGPEYVMAGEAGQHMGEEVTVCGYVQDYYYSDTGERPTLLLFNAVAPGGAFLGISALREERQIPFAVLILRKDKSNFPASFTSFYPGNIVCATGVIERLSKGLGRFSEDNPVIFAQSSSQLDVDCKGQSTDK